MVESKHLEQSQGKLGEKKACRYQKDSRERDILYQQNQYKPIVYCLNKYLHQKEKGGKRRIEHGGRGKDILFLSEYFPLSLSLCLTSLIN